jgi:hypothetical protein
MKGHLISSLNAALNGFCSSSSINKNFFVKQANFSQFRNVAAFIFRKRASLPV